MGTLELSNPPGWGRKKRANQPQSVSSATIFIVFIVEQCQFEHFNVGFFVSINVFFVIALGFKLRLHAMIIPVYGFSIVITLLTLKLIEHYKVICYVE